MGTKMWPDMKVPEMSARADAMVRVYSYSGAHAWTHPSWQTCAYRTQWIVEGEMRFCHCQRRGAASATGRYMVRGRVVLGRGGVDFFGFAPAFLMADRAGLAMAASVGRGEGRLMGRVGSTADAAASSKAFGSFF